MFSEKLLHDYNDHNFEHQYELMMSQLVSIYKSANHQKANSSFHNSLICP